MDGSVLSPFRFAVVVDIVSEFSREDEMSELLYTDDIVLMSETIKGLRNLFLKWMEAFVSKVFKIGLMNTKLMVRGGSIK